MSENPLTPEQVLIAAAAIGFSNRDVVVLEQGIMTNVHSSSACLSYHCWVHRPSAHHMVTWPIRWRQDKRTAERVCEHKVGHPDPDDRAFNLRNGKDVSMHGCDGCCGVVPEEN